MTGSLAIQSYLEMIFRHSSSISGPLASIVYGFVQLGAGKKNKTLAPFSNDCFLTLECFNHLLLFLGISATFLARCFGRRILMLISSLGVGISLTIVGIYFYLQDYLRVSADILTSVAYMPLIGIIGFNVLYTIGIGNLPYVMQAELFPINVKAVASSAATMSACVFSFTVAKGYQSVKDLCGHFTVFWIFASFAYAGVFFIYFLVPETKGKTLEEVQDNLRVKPREEGRSLRANVTTVDDIDE